MDVFDVASGIKEQNNTQTKLPFFLVPPQFISSPQNVTVIDEQNVNLTLDCTVYGNPTPDVKWTKDGHDILENQRINVSDFKGNTSSLTITNVVRGDEGRTLDCTVYGNPTPDVKWTKDGHDILENQRINVSDFKGNTSSLTITNVVRGDEGRYRCLANNSVNITTSAPGKLIVNCEYYFRLQYMRYITSKHPG